MVKSRDTHHNLDTLVNQESEDNLMGRNNRGLSSSSACESMETSGRLLFDRDLGVSYLSCSPVFIPAVNAPPLRESLNRDGEYGVEIKQNFLSSVG